MTFNSMTLIVIGLFVTLSMKTFNIMTLGLIGLFVTLSIITLSIMTLGIMTFIMASLSTECHSAENQLFIFILNAMMHNV